MVEIHGACPPEYGAVKDAFAASMSTREVGASVALFVAGECAVNLWAGHTDRRRSQPWQEDTLCCVFSMSKGITAVAVLQQVDAGRIALDAPVADYWPEFGEPPATRQREQLTDRRRVTVRHLLSHQCGLPGFHEPVSSELYYDWPAVTAALASEPLWWPPGSTHGYHARTYGFLLGEVFRRVTGLHIADWVRREWKGVDFHFGVPESDLSRCAQMLPARIVAGEARDRPPAMQEMMDARQTEGSATWAAFQNPSLGPGFMNKQSFRQSNMPAVSGHATAAAVAGVYGRIHEYVSPALMAEALKTHSRGKDEVLRSVSHYGLGFMLDDSQAPIGFGKGSFGHAGAGGSIGFGDVEREEGFAFVMNQMEEGVVTGGRSASDIFFATRHR